LRRIATTSGINARFVENGRGREEDIKSTPPNVNPTKVDDHSTGGGIGNGSGQF
jgi:hypothetical protein